MARTRTETAVPTVDLTHDLNELAALAARVGSVDELLRRGLDWLARLAP